jgi:hypothetical protein
LKIPDRSRTAHGQGKRRVAAISGALAAVIASPALIATPAYAAATVTPADPTTMSVTNSGPSATYTSVTANRPVISEAVAGDVSAGRVALLLPAGFEFRTSQAVTLSLTGAGTSMRPSVSTTAAGCPTTNRTSLSITPTATAITFYVCAPSTKESILTFTNIAVRPTTATVVTSAKMYLDASAGAATIAGVTGGPAGTSFGNLVVTGATTQLAVAIPTSVTAGNAQTVTVTARDANGTTTPDYRGAIRFTATDPAATLPADYTFTAADNGVHTFTGGVTLKTAGNRSVTATDKATASITGVGSTTVVAAAATSMTLTGIANPATAGAPSSATVSVRDAYSNLATGYRGTVGFTSTDAAATLPAGYAFTAGDAGSHVFTGVVLRTAGNQGVTATDGTLTGTQTPITVQPGILHHLVLSPASATISAGGTRAFTAQGRDASDNNLGDMTAATTFTVAPNGSCAANSCTATVAGAHTVTGTRSGASGTAALQVNPAAPQVTVALAPPSIVANGTATSTVTVHAADQYGNPRAGDPVVLDTDGDATLSALTDNGDGSYTATLTASTVAGTQTVSATDGAASASTMLTQVPDSASQVTLTLAPPTVEADGTSTSNATITVADASGNPRTGDPVTLTTDGDVMISAVTDAGFGTYTATVTASTTAGTETLTASAGTAGADADLVELAPLTVTGVGPASRGQGANGGAFGQSITLTGTGFTPGTLTDFGSGVTVKFTTYVSATQVVAHIVVAADATLGTRSVSATVSGDRSTTCVDCFTVTAGPQVTDVSPNEIGPGGQRTMTVTGSGFTTAIKVSVPASGVAVTSVTVVDPGTLRVALSTSSVAVAGPRSLVLTNPGDAGSTTCTGCFSVTAAPVVSAVSPSSLGGGAQTGVTVTGENFAAGARLSVAGTGVAVLSQSVVDANTLVATLSVSAVPVVGGRTITVVNPDAGRGACASCFSVNAAPTVTAISPAIRSRGTTGEVTITGTNLVAGASVSLGAGVAVSNVTVVDATTITATVAVAAGAGVGSRSVLVTNRDYGKGTCTGCFKVS